jgi:ankyrin repeat protein
LLFGAKRLKGSIAEYLESKGVPLKNELSPDMVEAICSGDVDYLAQNVNGDLLNECYFMEFESGNYLVHAIDCGSLESLKFFVEKGADLEAVCENKTPLMYSIKYGKFEMVKYLIASGADINANNRGRHPLYYAKTYGHPEIEKYLISKGAK